MRMFSSCFCLTIIFVLAANSQTIDPLDATWQQSQNTRVTLRLRDKNNDMCSGYPNYSCSFTITALVTGPDKKKYRLIKQVKDGDAEVEFTFPDDFNAYPTASGTYSVDFIVGGKVVTQNGFRWTESSEFAKWTKNPKTSKEASDEELRRAKIAVGYVCGVGIGSSGDGQFFVQTKTGKMEFNVFSKSYDETKKTIVVLQNKKQEALFKYAVTVYYEVDNQTSTVPLYNATKIIVRGIQNLSLRTCD